MTDGEILCGSSFEQESLRTERFWKKVLDKKHCEQNRLAETY